MNIFSRVKNAVVGLFGGFGNRAERPGVHERRNGKLDFQAKPRLIKFYAVGKGQSFYGPVGLPDSANHWVSRQTCRAMLRALAFHRVSESVVAERRAGRGRDVEQWTRRDRRRLARLSAKLEYRSLMQDKTNLIENEAELLKPEQPVLVGKVPVLGVGVPRLWNPSPEAA